MHGSGKRANIILMGLLLAGLTVAMYWPIGSHDFVSYDDGGYVFENPMVLKGLSWAGLRWAIVTYHVCNWHPLTWFSHMLDIELFGLAPGRHHLMSLVLHVINALLLFLVLRRLTGDRWRSWMVAALFAVHPLHVESVAWVAERKDVLSGLFWLLSLFAYLAYLRRPRPAGYLALLLLYGAGLMSKPMLVTLPLVLLLLDFWPLGRWPGKTARPRQRSAIPATNGKRTAPLGLLLEKAPLFFLALVSSVVTYLAQQRGDAVTSVAAFPLTMRLENALISYGAYIKKMFFPLGLCFFYPYPYGAISARELLAAAALLFAGSLAAVWLLRKQPSWSVGWFWYLGTLVPVIGVVQVGFQGLADRYTYIPLIGLFIGVCWMFPDRFLRSTIPRLACLGLSAGILVGLALLGRAQVRTWENNVTLYTQALAVTAGNYVAYANLGQEYYKQGNHDAALGNFLEALRFEPVEPMINFNVGLILVIKKQYGEALTYLRRAAFGMPQAAELHLAMGEAYEGLLDYRAAIESYREVIRIDPARIKARTNLGALYARLGLFQEAGVQFSEALRIAPNSAETRAAMQKALSEKRLDMPPGPP